MSMCAFAAVQDHCDVMCYEHVDDVSLHAYIHTYIDTHIHRYSEFTIIMLLLYWGSLMLTWNFAVQNYNINFTGDISIFGISGDIVHDILG